MFNGDIISKLYEPMEVIDELRVVKTCGFSAKLKFISREKTIEFASKCIETWGREYAEKVLSASITGSLYFHVIYHFESFENFLKECNTAPKKRLKVSKE